MKYRSVAEIDMFIDTNLFAFPYIDDVKEILEDGELEEINEYAASLKEKLKFINQNITKSERDYYDFYPRRIKEMFDSIMFKHYEKPFFNGLLKLLQKHGGYAAELIEDFYFKKQYDSGNMYSQAISSMECLEETYKLASHRAKLLANSKK